MADLNFRLNFDFSGLERLSALGGLLESFARRLWELVRGKSAVARESARMVQTEQAAASQLHDLSRSLLEAGRAAEITEEELKELRRALLELQQIRQSVQPVGEVSFHLANVENAARQSTYALITLSQLIQDAPYGFRAVANNLEVLIQQLIFLSGAARATGVSLSSLLLGSLRGPAGLFLAISTVSALLVEFGDQLLRVFGLAKAGKREMEELARAFRDVLHERGFEEGPVSSLERLQQVVRQARQVVEKEVGDLEARLRLMGFVAGSVEGAAGRIVPEPILREREQIAPRLKELRARLDELKVMDEALAKELERVRLIETARRLIEENTTLEERIAAAVDWQVRRGREQQEMDLAAAQARIQLMQTELAAQLRRLDIVTRIVKANQSLLDLSDASYRALLRTAEQQEELARLVDRRRQVQERLGRLQGEALRVLEREVRVLEENLRARENLLNLEAQLAYLRSEQARNLVWGSRELERQLELLRRQLELERMREGRVREVQYALEASLLEEQLEREEALRKLIVERARRTDEVRLGLARQLEVTGLLREIEEQRAELARLTHREHLQTVIALRQQKALLEEQLGLLKQAIDLAARTPRQIFEEIKERASKLRISPAMQEQLDQLAQYDRAAERIDRMIERTGAVLERAVIQQGFRLAEVLGEIAAGTTSLREALSGLASSVSQIILRLIEQMILLRLQVRMLQAEAGRAPLVGAAAAAGGGMGGLMGLLAAGLGLAFVGGLFGGRSRAARSAAAPAEVWWDEAFWRSGQVRSSDMVKSLAEVGPSQRVEVKIELAGEAKVDLDELVFRIEQRRQVR